MPFLYRNRDGEVVPSVACIQQPIVAVLVFAWEEHHRTSLYILLYRRHQLGYAEEPEQRRYAVDADDRTRARLGRLQNCTYAAGDVLRELLVERELQVLGRFEVAVAILGVCHPLRERVGQIALQPTMSGLLGGQLEQAPAYPQPALVALVVDNEYGVLSAR